MQKLLTDKEFLDILYRPPAPPLPIPESALTSAVPVSAPRADMILVRTQDAKEVIRIGPDGRIYWFGREVETDDDFRSAMMELAAMLAINMRPLPCGPT